MFRQGELFERPKRNRRGWTELDKIRRRIAKLEKRCSDGDATALDMERILKLKELLARREEEAKQKWKNSCGS